MNSNYSACLFYLCSEINAGFFYKSAEEREKLVASERKFIDDRVQKVIDLKKKVHYFFLKTARQGGRACS